MTQLVKMLQAVALIIIYLFLCLDQPLHVVDWRKWIIALWFAFGTVIFVMGFISKQSPGYWMSGPVFAIGFPTVYFVLLQTDYYKKHLQYMAKIVLVISAIYFVITAFTAPIINPDTWIGGRYNGIAFDCNRVGELAIIAFCCGFYIVFEESSKFWRALSAIVIGISVGMIILTQSRTAFFAIILIAVFWAIVLLWNREKPGKKAFALFLVAVAFACATYGLIQAQHKSEIVESNPGVTAEEIDEGDVLDRAEISDGNLDSYSSGRLRIWGHYASHFNLTGNKRADDTVPIDEEDTILNAHNNTVEFTYRSGILAGLLYVTIQICMLVFGVKTAFTKGSARRDCFASSVFIGFGVFSNLMAAYAPFGYAIFFFTLMTQIPIFEKKEKKEKKETEGRC